MRKVSGTLEGHESGERGKESDSVEFSVQKGQRGRCPQPSSQLLDLLSGFWLGASLTVWRV